MGDDSNDRLVALGTSFNNFQAQIIKTKLESNDIPCFLFNTESFNAMSHLSLAIGGIRVMVLKSDLKEAAKTLEECESELH